MKIKMNKDKITHKEHRQLLSGLYKRQGGKWIYQADTYIKQQEKQEKLLKLYKEYVSLSTIPIHGFEAVQQVRLRQSQILKEIKELENE